LLEARTGVAGEAGVEAEGVVEVEEETSEGDSVVTRP